MERLNGGEFLLDLTPITIEESTDSETYTNITNAKVLEQLTNLKRYIPNEKAIKPVWVKFVNDETDEIVVVKGELAKIIGDEEFEIHIKTKGYELTIHIEFTQAVNDNSDPIDDWYIDTNDAKYLFLSNAQNIVETLENEDVVAKTLLQTDYNWISDTPTLKAVYLNGLTAIASYMKAVQINRRLDIIISVMLENQTENTITTSGSQALIDEIALPEDIAKLIYRKDGSTCDGAKSYWDGILSTNCIFTRMLTGVGQQVPALVSSPVAKKLTIFMPSGSTYSLSAGEKCALDIRVTLLL